MALPDYLAQPCPTLDVTPCNQNVRKTKVGSLVLSLRISPDTLVMVTRDICTWWILIIFAVGMETWMRSATEGRQWEGQVNRVLAWVGSGLGAALTGSRTREMSLRASDFPLEMGAVVSPLGRAVESP